MNKQVDLIKISTEAREFRDSFQTLQIASADHKGRPTASYAPFVQLDEDKFGIYISELATHSQNLTENPFASIMFIEPEAQTTQLFARKRLVYSCKAARYARNSSEFTQVMDALKQRFPETMGFLESMHDFNVFIFSAHHASFVKGFAQAFEFEGGSINKANPIVDKEHNEQS